MSPLLLSIWRKRRLSQCLAMPCAVLLIAVMISGCGDTANKSPTPTPAPAPATTPATPPSQVSAPSRPDPTKPADNTAQNKRDDGSTVTPLDQGMSEADTAITQAIRKAVVAEKGLSINAQNVKIITKDGTVTLRGPVVSEAERQLIATKAQEVAGVRTVTNNLEVVTQ